MKRILRGPVLVVGPSFIGMLKISGVVDDPRVVVGWYYRTVPYRTDPAPATPAFLGGWPKRPSAITTYFAPSPKLLQTILCTPYLLSFFCIHSILFLECQFFSLLSEYINCCCPEFPNKTPFHPLYPNRNIPCLYYS